MIITAKANGDVLNIKPSVFYQGSTEANRIYLIAPFAINSSVSVGFTLPNTHDIPVTLMTPSTVISDTLNTWVYDVPATLTQYVGIVKVNISITTPSGNIITLNRCQFEVKRGDEVVLPEEPEADVYATIVQALAQVNADYINKVDISYTDTENEISQSIINSSLGLKLIKTIGDMTVTFEVTENGVEIDGIDIKEQVLNAVATANEAKSIAENAESVANGIDAKASEALSNSETAVSTANEAKAIALGVEQAKVFDTFADMETWLKDEANKGLHSIGLELLIKDNDVPDYWVTAVLETPNANGYYYDIEENEASVLSVNGKKGIVVLKTDDISDTDETNKWSTAEEKEKISKILINGDGTKALLNDGEYGEVGTVDTVNNVLPDENKNITITADDIEYDEDNSVKDELDIKVNTADIINNLMSTDTNKPLSALQGKYLKDIIDTKNFGKAFNTISDMVSDLNSASSTDYRTAFNLLIVALEVPDFWITEIMASSVAYTYTTDQALIDAVAITPVQIGFYKISKLETAKVDLSNYATKLSIGQWQVPYRDLSGTGEPNASRLATVLSPLASAILIRDNEGKATFTGGTSANQGIVKSQLDSAVAGIYSNSNTFSGPNNFTSNLKRNSNEIGVVPISFNNSLNYIKILEFSLVLYAYLDIRGLFYGRFEEQSQNNDAYVDLSFYRQGENNLKTRFKGYAYETPTNKIGDFYYTFDATTGKVILYYKSNIAGYYYNKINLFTTDMGAGTSLITFIQLDTGSSTPPVAVTSSGSFSYTEYKKLATVEHFTATLPSASWTGSSAPYSKEVTVSGILATDKLDIDLDLSSSTYSNVETIQTDWSKIYRAVSGAGTITFYASEVPTIDIPLQIKVVR